MGAYLMVQSVKNLPTMQKSLVPFLSVVDPLEEEMAISSLIPTLVFLPGKSHGQTSLAGYTAHGVATVQQDLATKPPPPPP